MTYLQGENKLPYFYADTHFNPTMDAIRVKMKNTLQKSAGSLKKNIPTNTVPTAPIPVHTAYAVPIGNDCDALYNRIILMVKQTKNPVIHNQ